MIMMHDIPHQHQLFQVSLGECKVRQVWDAVLLLDDALSDNAG